MLQPLAGIGALCRKHDVLFYVDCAAWLGGNPFETDAWSIDMASAGLQTSLGRRDGAGHVQCRVADLINKRKHSNRASGSGSSRATARIRSNYFDLAMLMDYWSPKRLNHHTEAASMLYAARECARSAGGRAGGWLSRRSSRAAHCGRVSSDGAKTLRRSRYRMANVTGVIIPKPITDGEKVRREMLHDFGMESAPPSGRQDLASAPWAMFVARPTCCAVWRPWRRSCAAIMSCCRTGPGSTLRMQSTRAGRTAIGRSARGWAHGPAADAPSRPTNIRACVDQARPTLSLAGSPLEQVKALYMIL